GFRHVGNDGSPVEVEFNARSMARIRRAMNVVYEGFDEDDPDGPDEGVTEVDVDTNAGKVRVQLDGEWRGDGPADRLWILPVDHNEWGIVVSGDRQDAFGDVLEELELLAEGEGWSDSTGGNPADLPATGPGREPLEVTPHARQERHPGDPQDVPAHGRGGCPRRLDHSGGQPCLQGMQRRAPPGVPAPRRAGASRALEHSGRPPSLPEGRQEVPRAEGCRLLRNPPQAGYGDVAWRQTEPLAGELSVCPAILK